MQILIKSITKKLSKTGKTFWTLETSVGKMSCWDADMSKQIEDKLIGKNVEVEIQEEGQYKNLKAIMKVLEGSEVEKTSGEMIGESAKAKRKAEMLSCAVEMAKLLQGKTVEEQSLILSQVNTLFNDFMRRIGEPVTDDSPVSGK